MDLNLEFGLYEIALMGSMVLLCAGLTWYYLTTYLCVLKIKNIPVSEHKKPVSVVLSGKNQSEALRKNLAFWLGQKYPDFEVIVVFENTDEEVAELLTDYARRYPRLKLINANQSINFFDEQKFSLSIGVKSALHDIVILTQARFRPASEHCLDYIQSAFDKDTKVVVGSVRFNQGGGICSFADFLEFEQNCQSLSAIAHGTPLTARRDLIAYDKDYFLEHRGYADSYALDSGSFDKLYPLIRHRKELNMQLHPGSEAHYAYPHSLSHALRTERQYKNTLNSIHRPAKLWISALHWMNLAFFTLLILGFIQFFSQGLPQIGKGISLWFSIFLLLALCKFTLQAILTQKVFRKAHQGVIWFMLPLYEILYLPLCLSLKVGIGKKHKGR